VQDVVNGSQAKSDLFSELIESGLLPKYAFPIDVVKLSIPDGSDWSNGEYYNDNAMQRELQIALAEYAPGSEVFRNRFDTTFKYRSVALYDPFNKEPNYKPVEKLIECEDCKSVNILDIDAVGPTLCEACGSPYLKEIPYLRPPGFTVDCAEPNFGAERYEGGGADRSGFVAPARLLVGETAFHQGRTHSFAPRLYSHVRIGKLFTGNEGPDANYPGFLICPVCGRALDVDDPRPHVYPNDIPPHYGRRKGPRAGSSCPNTHDFRNQVMLGYRFYSEVIMLGVDLPVSLDAPLFEPAGRAVWYSFGSLVASAGAIVLQVDPDELKVGVRAVSRGPGRTHGEVYLYDDVPGGAGYARAIEKNLAAILSRAYELGSHCTNPDCSGACYHCMFDYRNQFMHPILDRRLGASVIAYVLNGTIPSIRQEEAQTLAAGLAEYARASWTICQATTVGDYYFPLILKDRVGQQVALHVIHPMQARPSAEEKARIFADSGLRIAVHTSFDLERRPFWVLNNLL
jgi:hypothetical protein